MKVTTRDSYVNSHVQSTKTKYYIADCTITKLYSNKSTERVPCSFGNDSCHYIGRSESHPDSVVAISTCDGLVRNILKMFIL